MPGTSPRGPRWKRRWRGDLPPLHRPCFHYTGKNSLPEYASEFGASRPPQLSCVLDASSTPAAASKSVVGHQCKIWNLDDWYTNDVNFSAYMCLSLWKMGKEAVSGSREKVEPRQFVLGKQESQSFLRADRIKQTRGWLGKEKTFSCWLMFPHFASAYFHCPRTSPEAKSPSSHNNTGCHNALLCAANVIFRIGEERLCLSYSEGR